MKNPYTYHQSLDPEQQVTLQPMGYKSTSTVPMYAVGLIVFLIYTCCKVSFDRVENRISKRYVSISIGQEPINVKLNFNNVTPVKIYIGIQIIIDSNMRLMINVRWMITRSKTIDTPVD